MHHALISHIAICSYGNVLLANDNVIVRLCIVLYVHTLLLVALAMFCWLTLTNIFLLFQEMCRDVL
jgi:hypothetical protein